MGKARIVKDKDGERLDWDREGYLERNEMMCCCFLEIEGIEDINDPFTSLVTLALDRPLRSVVLFTTTNNNLSGDRLMDLIHEKKLGKVEFQGPFRNANSGNNCWLYTWHVHENNWARFCRKIENLNNNRYQGPY
jgi:hypothetical protein